MTGDEFIKCIRRLGRERGVTVRFEPRKGKGSHGRLYFGHRFTTMKDRRKKIRPRPPFSHASTTRLVARGYLTVEKE